MSVNSQEGRCPNQPCIYNVLGLCRHALHPNPSGCAYRRSTSIVFERRAAAAPVSAPLGGRAASGIGFPALAHAMRVA